MEDGLKQRIYENILRFLENYRYIKSTAEATIPNFIAFCISRHWILTYRQSISHIVHLFKAADGWRAYIDCGERMGETIPQSAGDTLSGYGEQTKGRLPLLWGQAPFHWYCFFRSRCIARIVLTFDLAQEYARNFKHDEQYSTNRNQGATIVCSSVSAKY